MATKGQRTAAAVREKATEFFFVKGFSATTLREVASAAGVKVSSLYNHISSKEDLLQQVMGSFMDDIIADLDNALDGKTEAIDRLLSAIDCHLRFHATQARKVFIGNNNLRFLGLEARNEITTPGQMLFTVTPVPQKSIRSDLVRLDRPAFEAA